MTEEPYHWLEAIGNRGLDSNPFVPGEAIEDVDQVETLGPLGVIDGGEIDQVVEIGFELQEFEYRDCGAGLADEKILSEVGGTLRDLAAELLLELFGELAVPWRGRHGGGRLGRSMSRGRLCRRRWFGALGFGLVSHS